MRLALSTAVIVWYIAVVTTAAHAYIHTLNILDPDGMVTIITMAEKFGREGRNVFDLKAAEPDGVHYWGVALICPHRLMSDCKCGLLLDELGKPLAPRFQSSVDSLFGQDLSGRTGVTPTSMSFSVAEWFRVNGIRYSIESQDHNLDEVTGKAIWNQACLHLPVTSVP